MRGLCFAILASLILAGSTPLSATAAGDEGLKACNGTNGTAGVAVGYRQENGWQSEGLTAIARGTCKTMLAGPLTGPHYYVYAVDDAAGAWQGNTFLCTRESDFHIFGTGDCRARGYTRTPFFEIETHGEQRWLVDLRGPGATAAVIKAATTVWSQSTPI
jgi:uncharacterized membrane protein